MEKRIGTVLILIEEASVVPELNKILFNHSSIIIGRQGIPMHAERLNVISLVVIGTTDEIGSLSGQVGRLAGIQVKSVVLKKVLTDKVI